MSKFIFNSKNFDPILRKIYYLIYLLFYFSFDYWYLLSYKININFKFPFSYNILYSISRGKNRNLTMFNKYKVKKLLKNKDNIKLISTGDTSVLLENLINEKINDGLLLHLGDYVYTNEAIPFQDIIKNKQVIFTPGCRELIPYSNNDWREQFKNKIINNFYIQEIELKDFKIEIFIISNYVFPGSKEYYDQIDWLNININNSKAKYKIITCHNPPYSVARHGDDYINKSIIELSGISQKIDLVLSGHDHTYQRFNINNIPYIVAGLGGHSKYKFVRNDINLIKKYNTEYGFLELYFDINSIEIKFINIYQEIIDQININPKD